MPGIRRNAKASGAFKHALDERHSCDLPKQPEVIPPKHIPLPDIPVAGELQFEIESIFFALFAVLGQYINLYRSGFWLPNVLSDQALHVHLIDTTVVSINLVIILRRIPGIIIKKVSFLFVSVTQQPLWEFYIFIATYAVLIPTLAYLYYELACKYGLESVFLINYPAMIYLSLICKDMRKYAEQKVSKSEDKDGNAPTWLSVQQVHHACSMVPATIREEVELFRNDFNTRWKLVLFNTFLISFYASFTPWFFAQETLHFDARWTCLHTALTTFGCFCHHLLHFFPPKYCDVLHRASMHLGGWQKVEPKNFSIPINNWSETLLSGPGTLIKYSNKFFKSMGISNAAEPGNSRHYRYQFVFRNPSRSLCFIWSLHLLLMGSEVCFLMIFPQWHELISIVLLLLMNFKTLYSLSKISFILKKIYEEECLMISKLIRD